MFWKRPNLYRDFVVADDLDSVIAIIDAGLLQSDTEMLLDVNSFVENLPFGKKSGQHQRHICSKNCLSESGLSRHVKLKRQENFPLNKKSRILRHS